MLKNSVLPVGILLVGLTIIAVLVMAKPEPTPQPPAAAPANIEVRVAEALPKTMRLSVTTQGTVEPKHEINLVAQVSGQIVSIDPNFVSGGFFKKAQTLVQIDDRDYQVALLSAEARLIDAERRLAEEEGLSRQAQNEWRELGSQNANDLFLRKPQLAAAKAGLAFAKADLEMAQLNVERTQIAVPFDGRIKQIHADLGQFVTAGSPVASVYDSTQFQVRLPLTETQAALIEMPLAPTNTAERPPEALSEVTIRGRLAGVPHEWKARLTRADSFVDPESRMYYVIAEVAAPTVSQSQGTLLPGLFVEATIEGKEIADVIHLPRSALFQRNRVLSLDADQKIVSNTVDVLQKSEDHVWVKAPITEKTLITLDKQLLTPAGTIVQSILVGATPSASAEPVGNNEELLDAQEKD